MCGIIGINSNKEVTSTILNSLRKLEYRGYDSAGIATLNSGYIQEVKCEGRVENLEKIKLTATKSGVKTKKEVDELPNEEVYNLIFSHGFTTRDSVDDISGRGVGMEAVLTEVTNISGIISVSSEADKETKFTVKLPI